MFNIESHDAVFNLRKGDTQDRTRKNILQASAEPPEMPAESVIPEEKVSLVFGNVLMVLGRRKISTRLSSKFIMFSL